MIGQQLCCGVGLRHVVNGHAVVVFLVGIEIIQSGSFGTEAYACTDIEPTGKAERSVEAWRESRGSQIGEWLQGCKAQTKLYAEAVYAVNIPK